MKSVFGPSLEGYAKGSRIQLALSHLSPSNWYRALPRMALGTPADQAGLIQIGNSPDWASQMLLWRARATCHPHRDLTLPYSPTVPVDPQSESVRQTGNKKRHGNGDGYEAMGAVGYQYLLTSILPRATSSSAGQTEENKLRALSLPLPFSVSQDPPTTKRPPYTDVPREPHTW